jgi:acetate kinase
MDRRILTINGGSSSIKFAVFSSDPVLSRVLAGQVDRIGLADTTLSAHDEAGRAVVAKKFPATDHAHAADHLIDWLRDQPIAGDFLAIGHRVVHGGIHLVEHQRITAEVLSELRRAQPLDPPHLPREIALIEAFEKHFPSVPQFACFDTAFHRDLPRVAQLLPIPRRYIDAGVRRFGFHGLSCQYLMEELERLGGEHAARGRVILAHLGNGASMTAVFQRCSVDTSMSFTPAAGLVMSTRTGDLDPGLLLYLQREQKRSAEEMDAFVNKECGLLGISGTSSDMRDLLARREKDPRAADAINLFSHQAKKFIGAYSAAMGGIDTIIFAGGIGEHASPIRAEICEKLQFLGIQIDPERNERSDAIISSQRSSVVVRVIKTDEEIIIAKIVLELNSKLGPLTSNL